MPTHLSLPESLFFAPQYCFCPTFNSFRFLLEAIWSQKIDPSFPRFSPCIWLSRRTFLTQKQPKNSFHSIESSHSSTTRILHIFQGENPTPSGGIETRVPLHLDGVNRTITPSGGHGVECSTFVSVGYTAHLRFIVVDTVFSDISELFRLFGSRFQTSLRMPRLSLFPPKLLS